MQLESTGRSQLVLKLVILGVAINGVLIIGGTLLDEFVIHDRGRELDTIFGIPLVSGITLVYLSSLLARRKRNAWVVGVPLYAFILGLNVMQVLLFAPDYHRFAVFGLLRNIAFPLLITIGLIYYRNEFKVKSDIQTFRQSLRIIIILLVVTFCYGVAGFMLMDKHDFHQEIGLVEAMHRTVDQFGLTTSHALVPYTRRAQIFVDSLSIISIGSLVYIAVSLFQPLRSRFSDQAQNRERVFDLLKNYPASSEDFFKLWPHDKQYFFDDRQSAALALHVYRGVALVVGDPVGNKETFSSLLEEFNQLCHGSDWQPAIIHSEPKYNDLYKAHGFSLQKIGEEAIVNLEHFQNQVTNNKYFRHINTKFTKQDYVATMMKPPHHQAVLERLQTISHEWLEQPGRTERGLMMGYFSSEYLEQSDIMVIRDGAGTIQAFLNQIPSFDFQEANFDMLRHSRLSPGNINDFLLMNFIDYLSGQGFQRLNLGLCPLSGLDKKETDHTLIDNTLRFAYANGDRLYSFSGLHRFKAKYEPEWSDRYIAFRGGIRGFTKTLTALNKAMKVPKRLIG